MSSSSSPTSEVAHHGASDHCLNCATLLAPGDKFCRACGQDTANHPPTLFEFVHEFVAHYVALEGTLWRSLKGLAIRPGFLTGEYLAGRKTRYVLPLRLLLTLGFIFFLTVKLVPEDPEDANAAIELGQVIQKETQDSGPTAPSVPAAASATLRLGVLNATINSVDEASSAPGGRTQDADRKTLELEDSGFPAWVQPQIKGAQERWNKSPQGEYDRLMGKVRGLMPYAVLCSLPFFAGILSMVFWWRRMTYGAHFVFAMHLHAFFYLGLMLLLIPNGYVQMAVFAWVLMYPLLAIKRVYANNWLAAIGSSAVVFVLHATLQGLMFATVFAIGALAP